MGGCPVGTSSSSLTADKESVELTLGEGAVGYATRYCSLNDNVQQRDPTHDLRLRQRCARPTEQDMT